MLTVQRIAFGTGKYPADGRALHMHVPFTMNGTRYPAGHWVVLYPDKREVASPDQFRNRYREVGCAKSDS